MTTTFTELALELLINNEVSITQKISYLGFTEVISIKGILKKIGNMFFVEEDEEHITFDPKDVCKVNNSIIEITR